MSVVIPTYNRAHLIERTIQSALDQTYAELEVIVVDDCSTDSTAAIVKRFPDPRVQYLRHATNRGGSAARNTGIESSTGEFIAFLDSDDEWLPEKLERQVSQLRRLPDNVGLVYTGALRLYEQGSTRRVVPSHRGRVLEDALAHRIVINTSAMLLRRDAVAAVSGFDESLPAYQDVDFWVRIAERYDVDFISDYLVRVHIHTDPVRISNDHERRIRGRLRFLEKHREQIEAAGVSHLLLRQIAGIYHRGLNDSQRSRAFYRSAILVNPVDITSYALLLSTYIPRAVYNLAANWRRRLVADTRR